MRSATSGAGSCGLAPESKYLNLISLGLQNADLAGLDADLIIPASSISSAFGRGFAGLDADLIIRASSVSSAWMRRSGRGFDNSCVQCLICVWIMNT